MNISKVIEIINSAIVSEQEDGIDAVDLKEASNFLERDYYIGLAETMRSRGVVGIIPAAEVCDSFAFFIRDGIMDQASWPWATTMKTNEQLREFYGMMTKWWLERAEEQRT